MPQAATDRPSVPAPRPPSPFGFPLFGSWEESPFFPYLLPFGIFMGFLLLGSSEDETQYTYYPIKAVVTGLAILYVWKRLPSFRVSRPGLAIAAGLVGFAAWVGLEPYLVDDPEARSGGFNPFVHFDQTGWAGALWLISFRMLGFVLVVPIMEEVFWRGFLMRFLINPKADQVPRPADLKDTLAWLDYDLARFTNDDFEKIPLGTYAPVSFWVTTLAFASVHGPHWPLALVYGLIIGWLVIRTRNLGNCIVAHAVTNAVLGAYTLATQQWFWW